MRMSRRAGEVGGLDRRVRGQHLRQRHWLLSLNPELETGRHRCSWLTRALTSGGDASQLAVQLYGREIECDPYEARSLRCLDAIAGNLPLAIRTTLLHDRWRACARTGDRSEIVGDIGQQREQFAIDYQEQWAQLLTQAIRLFATPFRRPAVANSVDSRRSELIKQWTDEVTALSRHASNSVADEIDFITLVANEWDALGEQFAHQANDVWLEVIAASVMSSEAEQASVFRRRLSVEFADPFSVLTTMDSMYESAPAATMIAGAAVLTFCQQAARPDRALSADETKQIGETLKRECRGIDHHFVRQSLLDVSLAECISLSTLATIAEATLARPSPDFTWSELVSRDLGLQVAYATGRFVLG